MYSLCENEVATIKNIVNENHVLSEGIFSDIVFRIDSVKKIFNRKKVKWFLMGKGYLGYYESAETKMDKEFTDEEEKRKFVLRLVDSVKDFQVKHSSALDELFEKYADDMYGSENAVISTFDAKSKKTEAIFLSILERMREAHNVKSLYRSKEVVKLYNIFNYNKMHVPKRLGFDLIHVYLWVKYVLKMTDPKKLRRILVNYMVYFFTPKKDRVK